jgi:hypothetical protein
MACPGTSYPGQICKAHMAGEHPALSLLIWADAHKQTSTDGSLAKCPWDLYIVEVCSVENIERWSVAKSMLLQNLKDHAKVVGFQCKIKLTCWQPQATLKLYIHTINK